MPEATEVAGIYRLTERIAATPTDDEHLKAVQAQCSVLNQLYIGVMELCAKRNGLAAEALLRSLFESGVTTALLAKNKSKLNDFKRYGQFVHLRLLRFNTLGPPIKEMVERIVNLTDTDWQPLFDEFRREDWHKLGTKNSFIQAGHEPEVYDKYYRRASEFAHGGPYTTVYRTDDSWKSWAIGARPEHWKTLTIGVQIFAGLLMLHSLAVVNDQFKLKLEDEIKQLASEVDKLRAMHIDLLKRPFEDKIGS